MGQLGDFPLAVEGIGEWLARVEGANRFKARKNEPVNCQRYFWKLCGAEGV